MSTPEEYTLLKEKSINILRLPDRTSDSLYRGGIHTLFDLLSKTRKQLLKMSGIGEGSLNAIYDSLAQIGIAPGQSPSEVAELTFSENNSRDSSYPSPEEIRKQCQEFRKNPQFGRKRDN